MQWTVTESTGFFSCNFKLWIQVFSSADPDFSWPSDPDSDPVFSWGLNQDISIILNFYIERKKGEFYYFEIRSDPGYFFWCRIRFFLDSQIRTSILNRCFLEGPDPGQLLRDPQPRFQYLSFFLSNQARREHLRKQKIKVWTFRCM